MDDLVQHPRRLSRILTLYNKKRLSVHDVYYFVKQAVIILDTVITTEKIKKKILFGGQNLEIKRLLLYLDKLKFGVMIGDYELETLEKFGAMYGDD